jgi:DNA-directed RNA polymerase specialized sigma24 family protein
MVPESPHTHISDISTRWEQIRRAIGGPGAVDKDAVDAVLNRYQRAAYRYLLGALRDEDAALEMFQEFAVQFLQGRVRGANPKRGRFRDYLKGVLKHLIANYKRRSQNLRPPDRPGPVVEPSPGDDLDREFLTAWRDELLGLTWAALEEDDRQTGRPLYTVLRLRSDHPELRAPQLAQRLADLLDRPVTAGAARTMLYRARGRFAELLVEEVKHSLKGSQPGRLEDELIALGLMEYCRTALERPCPNL